MFMRVKVSKSVIVPTNPDENGFYHGTFADNAERRVTVCQDENKRWHEVHSCDTCYMQPGSDTARVRGCSCAVMDNARGHENKRWLKINLDCPLHGGTLDEGAGR